MNELMFKARKSKNLTQQLLAEKLGITQAMISDIEKQKKNPSLDVAWKLSEILGLEMKDFLKKEG